MEKNAKTPKPKNAITARANGLPIGYLSDSRLARWLQPIAELA
jgi:hypothetical protein